MSIVLIMSAKEKWAAADVPDQAGRVAIITGPNTGIRYEAAAVLADNGAFPTLRAATDPSAQSGQYYGPDGFGEQRGHPKVVKSGVTYPV